MSKLTIHPKSGPPIVIEGANEAVWRNDSLAPVFVPDKAAVLEVQYKDSTTTKILGRFNPKDTVGYTIES